MPPSHAPPHPTRHVTPGEAVRDGRRVRVLIADDHALMREGIAAVLADAPGLDVVAEAADGRHVGPGRRRTC